MARLRYWSPSISVTFGFTFLVHKSFRSTFKVFMNIKKKAIKIIVAHKTKGQK